MDKGGVKLSSFGAYSDSPELLDAYSVNVGREPGTVTKAAFIAQHHLGAACGNQQGFENADCVSARKSIQKFSQQSLRYS